MGVYSKQIWVPRNPFRLKHKNFYVWLYRISQRRGGFGFLTSRLAGLIVYFWSYYKVKTGTHVQLEATADLNSGGNIFTITDSNTQFYCIYSRQYQHLYEPEVEAALELFLQNNNHFLDVGSNWGYYGIKLALSNTKRIQVSCFEPSNQTYSDLIRIKEQLKLGSDFQTYHLALSANDGAVLLHRPGIESGLATIKGTDVRNRSDSGTGSTKGLINRLMGAEEFSEKIESKKLDSIDLKGCDVIKLDVEGAELDVLMGGRTTIDRFQPIVIFEHWFKDDLTFDNYRELFKKLNYDVFQSKASVVEWSGPDRILVDFKIEDVHMEKGHQYTLIAFPQKKSLKGYF